MRPSFAMAKYNTITKRIFCGDHFDKLFVKIFAKNAHSILLFAQPLFAVGQCAKISLFSRPPNLPVIGAIFLMQKMGKIFVLCNFI